MKVANALVSSGLDHRNALYTRLSHRCLHHLHWRPVKLRIDFKFLWLTFKALRCLAPNCISELLIPDKPAGSRRSSNMALSVVPRSGLVTEDDRAFAI